LALLSFYFNCFRIGTGLADELQKYGGLNWVHYFNKDDGKYYNLSKSGCPQDLKSIQTNSCLGGSTHSKELPCSHCHCQKGTLGDTSLFRCLDCKRTDPTEKHSCSHSDFMDSNETKKYLELSLISCLKGK
jgi:hypothetical protein